MMSRLTAADIIEKGEYLNPEFDPLSLTVPQLMGVLGYHNIHAPSPYTKTRLVQLFYDEITARSAKLKRERLKKTSQKASDDGIVDGLTGQPLSQERKPAAQREGSRKSSSIPPKEPIAPASRRSSLRPQLRHAASQKAALYESIKEQDNYDEDLSPPPSTALIKTTKQKAKRLSTGESGWEDNNQFQSGAESSSPSHPPKVTQRKLSAQPERISRKVSTKPYTSPSPAVQDGPSMRRSGLQATQYKQVAPIASRFEARQRYPPVLSKKDEEISDQEDEFTPADTTNDFVDYIDDEEEAWNDGDSDEHASVALSLIQPSRPASTTSWITRLILIVLSIPVTLVAYVYKTDSAFIGYCDTGSDTNPALEKVRAHWQAVEQCNRDNSTFLYRVDNIPASTGGLIGENIPCPPPALASFLHPHSCTPCPDHASCANKRATCDAGYLLRPHPFLAILEPLRPALGSNTIDRVQTSVTSMADGMPGLGSVALPARCMQDPQRKKLVGALGQALDKQLAQERGVRLCAGVTSPKGESLGSEAKRWGIELDTLRQKMRPDATRRPDLLHSFDDTFDEAIRQLNELDILILAKDETGKLHVAHRIPSLNWACTMTVRTRELWNEWQKSLYGFLAVVLASAWLRTRHSAITAENKKVAEITEIVFDALRNREFQHHTDPVTTSNAYISSIQLRDRLLEKESIAQRSRLWEKVERSVEANANVRASLQEVKNAGEMRVWTWVGASLDW